MNGGIGGFGPLSPSCKFCINCIRVHERSYCRLSRAFTFGFYPACDDYRGRR